MNKKQKEIKQQMFQIKDAMLQIEQAKQLLAEEYRRLQIEFDRSATYSLYDDYNREQVLERARAILNRGYYEDITGSCNGRNL